MQCVWGSHLSVGGIFGARLSVPLSVSSTCHWFCFWRLETVSFIILNSFFHSLWRHHFVYICLLFHFLCYLIFICIGLWQEPWGRVSLSPSMPFLFIIRKLDLGLINSLWMWRKGKWPLLGSQSIWHLLLGSNWRGPSASSPQLAVADKVTGFIDIWF